MRMVAAWGDLLFNSLSSLAWRLPRPGAGPSITLAYFVNKIESGELTYTWNVLRTFRLPVSLN
jgi:hypothetical protein